MLPLDKGVRNLLPPVEGSPDTLADEPQWVGGGPEPTTEFQPLFAPASQGFKGEQTAPAQTTHTGSEMPVATPGSPSSTLQISPLSKTPDGIQVDAPANGAGAASSAASAETKVDGGAAGGGSSAPKIPQQEGEASESANPSTGKPSDVSERSESEQVVAADPSDTGSSDTPQEAPSNQPTSEGSEGAGQMPAAEADDGHDVSVTQTADVDQDALIEVQGYAGEVVARFFVDQELIMDQDVEIDLDIDGNGQFALTISQELDIDQDTDIDLDIFDENGILYVNLYLSDVIEIDQDTSVDVEMEDGPIGGVSEITQVIEMDQDTDVDVSIEDDLEARYKIQVAVTVVQDVDALQDVDIDLAVEEGELELDVAADQHVAIDQEAIVKIDFALV